MSEQPTTPPAKLPPWAVRLIELGGMALALWLATRFGITLPPAPAPTPAVLVLNVGGQPPAPAGPVAVGK